MDPTVALPSAELAILEESLRRLRLDLAQARDVRAAVQALNVVERSILLFSVEPLVREFFDFPGSQAKDVDAELFIPEELELPRQWESVLREFVVESLRNWRAHGCESRAERKFLKKSEHYRVSLRFELKQGRVVVCFEDDGPGMHPANVIAKAESLGLLQAGERRALEEQLRNGSAASVYELLFRDGLSTNPNPDEQSGRGMGLARLASEARRLGGIIRAEKSIRLGGLLVVLELPCKVVGLSVSRVVGASQVLFSPRSSASQRGDDACEYRIFSLLPAESSAWVRETFGSQPVSWVSVESSADAMGGATPVPFRAGALMVGP